jgi:dTDP-4-dehydrorhamnose reductase
MKLRVLIFGKTGQLGWEFNRTAACLGEILSYDYPQIDFSKPEQIEGVVREAKPHLILNAVAYTAVDRAETEPEIARAVNATASGALAESARKVKAGLIHYSTDFVFNGQKGEAYTEADTPDPINVYGQTKLDGEQAIAAVGENYLIFRTSWVYSMRRDSFVTKVLEWARKNERVRVVADQVGSPTWARMLAEISTQAVVKGGNDPLGWMQEKRGLYHLGGNGSASRFEWAQNIIKNDPKPEEQVLKCLEPSSTAEFPTPAARPMYSPLNCRKFEATFGLRLPNWEEALALAMSIE